MAFPETRLRRLRTSEAIRGLVCETDLSPEDLIYPIFVTHGRKIQTPIAQMPGCYQLSLDNLLTEVSEVNDLGIPGVLLFGIPATKDSTGSEAYDEHGIIQEAIRTIKQTAPGLLVTTDVCLCQYTDHGHCGVVHDGNVDNDATLDLLTRTALSHAEAGADIVAPSAMMDGQVGSIRKNLDSSGYRETVVGLQCVFTVLETVWQCRSASRYDPQVCRPKIRLKKGDHLLVIAFRLLRMT